MRTFCFVLLAVGVIALLLWISPAEPATVPDRYAYGYTGQPRSCLWCGRRLGTGRPYFDADRCGKLFGEQLAVRGYLVFQDEIVDVNGDVRPHPP